MIPALGLDAGDDAQRLLDAVPMLLASCDRDGRYTRVNRAYADRFGLTPAQLIGQRMSDVVGPDVFRAIAPLIDRVLAGERVEAEMVLTYPGVGERTLRSVLTPIRNPSGAVVGWDGVGDDVTGRRAVEARLRDFAFLAENASDFIGMADLEFRPLFVNEAARRMSGASEPTAGLSVFDFVVPEHHALLRDEVFPRVLRDGRASADVQFRNMQTGDRYWMEYNVIRMENEAGTPTGYATISRSLEERMRAEGLLRVAAAEKHDALVQIRELADSMPQIVWAADAAGTQDYFNRQWYVRTRTSRPGEVDPSVFLHPDDRVHAEGRWQEALQTGLPVELELRMRFPDEPDYRWYLTRIAPVRDAEGRVVRWYGTSTDIDQQKRAEHALAENQERLRAALEASGTGTFRWDMRTNALHWDANLDRLFGLEPHATVRSLDEFLRRVHDDDRARLVEACERPRAEGADFEQEFRVVWPDGTTRWLYDKGRTHRDAEGRPVYMAGACVDVTERRRKEDALREADRQKDEFLGTLAHELRNPLAPLTYAVALLKQRIEEPSTRRPLDVIDRQIARIARLVDDLLDVSRITEGKLSLVHERIVLGAVVADAIDVVRPAASARHHRLSLEIASPVAVVGDPHRLGQVFENLIGNAVKYTPDGGEVRVEVACEDEAAVVRVRDTGVGIAPDVLPQVFKLFVQGENAVSHAPGGLGIGLTLVDRLTQLHGGRVTAHSAGVGLGSEFVVRLPVAPAAQACPEPV